MSLKCVCDDILSRARPKHSQKNNFPSESVQWRQIYYLRKPPGWHYFWGYRDEFLVSAGSGWTRRAGLSRRKITAEAWGGLANPRPVQTVVFNCVTNFVPQCHSFHYACSSIKTNFNMSGTFSFAGNEGSLWDMRGRRPHGSATLRAAGS